jgi:lysocardiolipin and lysophospholipid acyltransferase
LLQYFVENNQFPADDGVSTTTDGKEVKGAGYIETGVRPVNPFEWFQVLVPGAALLLVVNVLVKMFGIVLKMLRIR